MRRTALTTLSLAIGLLIGSLFAGSAAHAQDQPFDVVIGDNCFVTEVTVTQGALVDAEYQIFEAGSITELLVQVPCGDEEDPEEPDEVLGEVVLAYTGSDVNVPVSVGFSLIGVGGLALYAARRVRNRDEADDLS